MTKYSLPVLWLCFLACFFIGCKNDTYKSHAISLTNTDDRIFVQNGKAFGAVRGVNLKIEGVEKVIPSLTESTKKGEAAEDNQLITLTIGKMKLEFLEAQTDSSIAFSFNGKAAGTVNPGDTIKIIDGEVFIDDEQSTKENSN